VSFRFQCPRSNLDPWVYELPDSHFDIKQFALRVAALAYGFPLEEPLLWCALNPDGYSHSAIRSAPVQESHPSTPFFPDRQQANVCPGGQTIRLLVHQAAGYSVVCRRAVKRAVQLTCGPNDSVRFPVKPK
jgi:hypothetical protein